MVPLPFRLAVVVRSLLIVGTAIASVLTAPAVSSRSISRATGFSFNTDNGNVYISGVGSATVNGTPYFSLVIDGVQQFRFLGDLNFVDGDIVTAVGSRPLSLFAGNNVNIAHTVTLNFDTFERVASL